MLAAVQDCHLGGKARQEERLFHCRVAAADDGDFQPRKKKPSQVAQLETPWPMSFCSLSRPSQRADAPEAMMSERVRISPTEVTSLKGCACRVRGLEVRHLELRAEALGLLLHVGNQIGPLNAFRPAGKVFHQRGDGELAAGFVAFQHQRFEAGGAV